MISATFVEACIAHAYKCVHQPAASARPPGADRDHPATLGHVRSYPSSDSSGSPPPPHFVSDTEAEFYYAGLSPSPPKLVYRTGLLKTPWSEPTGFEAYRRLKRARGVFGHRLNDVWEDVGPQIRDLLTLHHIQWTSIDVARFITDGEGSKKITGPVVIWIGVCPDSLQGEQAFSLGNQITELLESFGIDDVDTEFRESIYRRLGGPPLLCPVSSLHHTVDVRGPLTPALGLSISASNRQDAQGTMGLYFAEGGTSSKVLGLTCNHVLSGADTTSDTSILTNASDAPRKHVQLLGTEAFNAILSNIKICVGHRAIMLEMQQDQIQDLEEKLAGGADGDDDNVAAVEKKLRQTRALLETTDKAIEALENFYAEVQKDWSLPEQRIIGHVRSTPGCVTSDVGPNGFTEDWAAVELDGGKFKKAFKGNVIDLGAFRFICDSPYSRPPYCSTVTLRYNDPSSRFLPEDVPTTQRPEADGFQVPLRSSPSAPRDPQRGDHPPPHHARPWY